MLLNRFLRFALASVLIVNVISVLFAKTPPSASAAVAANGTCGVARNDGHVARSPKVASTGTVRRDYREAEEWLAGEQGQVAVRALNQAFGGSRGFVGLAADHGNQTVYVSIDSSADAPLVRRTISQIAAPFKVDVHQTCRSKVELDDVKNQLVAPASLLRAANTAFSARVDLATDSVVVSVPASSPEAKEVKAQFGDRVTIEDASPKLFARIGDQSPHYGGAYAFNPNRGNDCSTGFSVYSAFGVRGTLTAGHCGSSGDVYYSAWDRTAQHIQGIGYGAARYPQVDVQYMTGAPYQTYTNGLYVDPCYPCVRFVVGKGDAGWLEYVCTNGAANKAVCGVAIDNPDTLFCTDGCREHTARGIAFIPVACLGDSGGPVYVQSGSSGALARGTIIGGTVPDPSYACATNVYFHQVSTIEAQGVTILTTG